MIRNEFPELIQLYLLLANISGLIGSILARYASRSGRGAL